MAEWKRQEFHLPGGGEGSSTPLPQWQKPRLDVTIVKSLYDKPFDGSLLLALSKMRQAKREGRPVTNTVVMHEGKEVDLGPILLKEEERRRERERQPEPKPEPEVTENPSLELMALKFDKAKQERREQGREDMQRDELEAFMLYAEKTRQEKLAQGKGEEHVIVPPEKRQFVQGKCSTGQALDPYCNCSPLSRSCSGYNKLTLFTPVDAVDEYTDHYIPIWLHYLTQLRQTHCFDIDVHPGSSLAAGVSIYDFNKDAELMMELANRAIQEYNERECNVFKYKVLKIEKVNFTITAYFEYWMTVKVRNLTLGTPIETFQIHAGKRCRDGGANVIYCCQPKEEAVVGLANCDLCLRKLRGEADQGGKEKALEV